ncbi:cytochrome P450 7A1 [Astyanax mexicanus]|uniref:Cholesterol 7-alpha-monooxygenase n=1 Tax=Astyanax mexicanus TaxID=7994 RepID=A0A8B9KTU6_ASTMX|nr:cytochrome P450 7A1 [Astyanax mexicanus]KAG9274041.1 cholesterol 7-alpha-monooxygenase isoform X1 [Astyanax mexicanus]
MGTWLLILLASGLFYLLLKVSGDLRRRQPGEPQLVTGWLPFFGVMLDYAKNPLGFLRATQQKYGDIFTCKIAGKYLTFIMDPFSFPMVLRQGKNLDFHTFAMGFSQRVFGHADFTSPVYSDSYKDVHSIFTQTLQGLHLQHLSQTMLDNLQTVLQRCLPSESSWREEGLQCFTHRIMFEAGFLTLFGKKNGVLQSETVGMCMQKAKQDFLTFDQAFPILAAGLPISLCVRALRAREALAEKLLHGELHQRTLISDLIQRRMDAFDCMHLDETGKARTHVCMLWASQANTLPAAFWSLYYTLRCPEAHAAALAEVGQILQDIEDHDTPISLSTEQLDSMTVLESIISEALRLSSASIMIRVANDDFSLTLDSGKPQAIRKGDYIALYPQLIHMDPDIYSNPMEFRYNRYLDEMGQKRTQFSKNGRPLKNYLLPFGSGASKCPGRFFAMNEIKLFLTLVLWYYDLHLSDTNKAVLPDSTRAGLGILPPMQDVLLRYRARGIRYKERHMEERED